MAKILFIGSANMDKTLYLKTEHPDELTQECLNEIQKVAKLLGGKGANQARANRIQSTNDEIYFVGCVGDDDNGRSIITELTNVGVNTEGIKVLEDFKTDGRIITVDKNGDNKMMGYGDCIKQLTPEMIDSELLESSDIVAIQMKMPEETVKYVIEYCKKHKKTLVIDPTPLEKTAILMKNNQELLNVATYLTPNEEEAFALIGYMNGKDSATIKKEFKETSEDKRLEMIEKFVGKFPNVVATIGKHGVIYNNNGKVIRKETYPTVCKDSTGAGDTFNGAFIASMARGEKLPESIDYGLLVSSMKVRYEGAQEGVPTFEEAKKEKARLKVKTTDDNEDAR